MSKRNGSLIPRDKKVTFLNLPSLNVTYPAFEDLTCDTWFRVVGVDNLRDKVFFLNEEGVVTCFNEDGVTSGGCGEEYDIEDNTLVDVIRPKNITFTF